jgi:hypothetical protein
MAEEVQPNPISQETVDLLNQSAVHLVAGLIWRCRPVWPETETLEERAAQIGHCSQFVLDALGKVLQHHARDLVIEEQVRAQQAAMAAMAEKPEVTQ